MRLGLLLFLERLVLLLNAWRFRLATANMRSRGLVKLTAEERSKVPFRFTHRYGRWFLFWTGWKESHTNNYFAGQWVAYTKELYSGLCFYASMPGGEGNRDDSGMPFDVAPRPDQDAHIVKCDLGWSMVKSSDLEEYLAGSKQQCLERLLRILDAEDAKA